MKKILMVDDVSTNIKCATEVLKDGYELVTARSGQKALDILKDTKPDLIILDINMPDMDGFELLTIIKGKEGFTDVPIIFLTAENDKVSEEKGLSLGATDYITKPFGPKILLGRIEKALEIARAGQK